MMQTNPPRPSPEVPSADHYDISYVGPQRFFSFAHQIGTIIRLRPKSVLEVGVGTGIVADALRRMGVTVKCLDIEPSLNPDILGSVLDIPVADDTFDVACCCQVLEHLPFDDFPKALQELARVSTRGVVLSLPDQDRRVEFTLALPKLGRRTFELSLGRLRPHELPAARRAEMGHHWEIGFKGFPLRRVRAHIGRAGLRIERSWRVPEWPWHHFFLLRSGS